MSYVIRRWSIIGYGNIGTQVGIISESLGMKVLYHDQETKLPLGNAAACKTIQQVLEESDIVSLHVPGTAITKELINMPTNLQVFQKRRTADQLCPWRGSGSSMRLQLH